MDDLLHLSTSEGSTTSTDVSTDDKDLAVKEGDSINVNDTDLSISRERRRPVRTSSRKQDYQESKTILEFTDTQALRDAVYQQWLMEKRAKIKEKKIKETKSKRMIQDEEAKAIAKKEQLKVDAVKAYNKWKAKKDEDLVKKLKVKQQEKGRAITF